MFAAGRRKRHSGRVLHPEVPTASLTLARRTARSAVPTRLRRLRVCVALVIATVGFCGFITAALSAPPPADEPDTYRPRNSESSHREPPAPAEAVRALKLPAGFHATLFAGEPQVRQPIAMTMDERGRVWVAEAYSYGEWARRGEDRIVVLTDRDGDGVADERKIFCTGLNHVSSVEVGFGGVWIIDCPRLIFIQDKDGDGVPDGPPEIRLDGWTTGARHNFANGLHWGPDGWLYGLHGQLQESEVLNPATGERLHVGPGVWRYHPVTRRCEVVLRGLTNPWGLDWDAFGEMFLSNNVNGHLFHGLAGAFYERSFGADEVPESYERLGMIADAPHYRSRADDWRQDWEKRFAALDEATEFGGGHSHCGLMIYQGDNWPAAFRGHTFMCNTHGRRVNEDVLARSGAGFTAKRAGDFAVAENPWFRGVTIFSGPDGGVLLSDWCDDGECHDEDGVHRTSGRIYKITYGQPAMKAPPDLRRDTDAELVGRLLDKNEWFPRQARRLLQERAAANGKLDDAAAKALRAMAREHADASRRLRALWALHGARLLTDEDFLTASRDADEHIRAWAATLACDERTPPAAALARIGEMAAADASALVRLHLASAVGRVPEAAVWPLAQALMRRSEDAADRTLQIVLWHNLVVRPVFDAAHVSAAVPDCALPQVRQFLARWITGAGTGAAAFAELLRLAAGADETRAEDLLGGATAALRGRWRMHAPANWAELAPGFLASSSARIREAAVTLSTAFGDASALAFLRQKLDDPAQPAAERSRVLLALAAAQAPGYESLIARAFKDAPLRAAALRAMSALKGNTATKLILDNWNDFNAEEKSAALDTLCVRATSERQWLALLAAGKARAADLDAVHARQIFSLGDATANELLAAHWGRVQASDSNKQATLEKYRALLSAPAPALDLQRGHEVFTRACAVCHRLFGEGAEIGPDLTGSGRASRDYLLANIIDPSAVVPRDFQLTVVTLADGQTLSGLIAAQDAATLTLQTVAERRILARKQIAGTETKPVSMMPEGLLTGLSDADVRALFAFLMQSKP